MSPININPSAHAHMPHLNNAYGTCISSYSSGGFGAVRGTVWIPPPTPPPRPSLPLTLTNWTSATFSTSDSWTPSPLAPPTRQEVATRDLEARLRERAAFDPISDALLMHHATKRKRLTAELLPPLSPPVKKQKRVYRDDQQKIDLFFWMITQEFDWTYGEMLYKTALCSASRASETQTKTITHFFAGHDKKYPASRTLDLWLRHPYGRRPPPETMYCVDRPYTELLQIRPALTSFAAQVVQQRLVREAEEAIKVKNGLHVSIANKNGKGKPLVWDDLGAGTLPHVRSIFEKIQPLLWAFVTTLCLRCPSKGVASEGAVRKRRAINNVRILSFILLRLILY